MAEQLRAAWAERCPRLAQVAKSVVLVDMFFG